MANGQFQKKIVRCSSFALSATTQAHWFHGSGRNLIQSLQCPYESISNFDCEHCRPNGPNENAIQWQHQCALLSAWRTNTQENWWLQVAMSPKVFTVAKLIDINSDFEQWRL